MLLCFGWQFWLEILHKSVKTHIKCVFGSLVHRILIKCHHLSGYDIYLQQTKSTRFRWKSAKLTAYFRIKTSKVFVIILINDIILSFDIVCLWLRQKKIFTLSWEKFETNLHKYGIRPYSSENPCIEYWWPMWHIYYFALLVLSS